MTTLPQQTYILRDYQQELLQEFFAQWTNGNRRLLLQLPTSAGKTVLFSAVAQQFTQRGEGVLILAHREELLLQAKEKLEAVTNLPSGLIKSGYPINSNHLIQIASVQSLIRRKNWHKAGLVIVDEAHHSASATYTKILEYYSKAYILGVTATPARPDGQGFKYIYDSLILGKSVRYLIAAGYLSKFKLFAAPKPVITKGVRITAGEYNQRDLELAINVSLIMGDVINTWRKYALDKKTVVFTVSIAHSKQTTQAYINAGIAAEHLDGKTPANERKAILERFRTGQTTVLVNCGVISEGVDVPSIEAIQCIRPTKSLILWLQMVGRGLRIAPGKEHCIIIDHTQNWFFHGLPDEERQWSLEPISMKQERFTVKCPDCNHIFKCLPHERKPFKRDWDAKQEEYIVYSKVTCPSCTTEFNLQYREGGEPPPERELTNDLKSQVEEISLECDPKIMATILRLKAQQKAYEYKPMWVYHKLVNIHPNIGLSELRECAKQLGYNPGWAWYRWQDLQQRLSTSETA